ncbi:MAG: restriction endonuclease, partial [Candidatus Nanopelagicales bacterium]
TLVVPKAGRLSGFEVTGLPVEPTFQLIEATMPEGTVLTHPLWPRDTPPNIEDAQIDPATDVDESQSIENESPNHRSRRLPDRGYITCFEEAERNAAEHMILMGFHDARVTTGGADGGIDVTAHNALAQVKWRGGVSGRPDLQRLYGARGAALHKQLLFFSAAGYSNNALDYADSTGIALFVFEPTGELTANNTDAETLLAQAAEPHEDNQQRDRREAPASERMQFLQWLQNPQTSDRGESGHPHS